MLSDPEQKPNSAATAAPAGPPGQGQSASRTPKVPGGRGEQHPAGRVLALSLHSPQPRGAYLRSGPGSGSTGSAAERWETSDPGSPLPRPGCALQPPRAPGSRAQTTAPPYSRKRQKRAPPIIPCFPRETRRRLLGDCAHSFSAREESRLRVARMLLGDHRGYAFLGWPCTSAACGRALLVYSTGQSHIWMRNPSALE